MLGVAASLPGAELVRLAASSTEKRAEPLLGEPVASAWIGQGSEDSAPSVCLIL